MAWKVCRVANDRSRPSVVGEILGFVEVPMNPAKVIVVGGSAGALSILLQIVKDFPEYFPASVFVVLHVSMPQVISLSLSTMPAHSSLPLRRTKKGSFLQGFIKLLRIDICLSPTVPCA